MRPTAQDFEKLVKKDKYQVFLFTSPATVPFCFVRHPWFVTNRKGVIARWDIFWEPERHATSWGYLHKDFQHSYRGIEMFFFSPKYFWRASLEAYVEGNDGSVAHRMAEFIETSPQAYPHCNEWSLLGPNSVTYAQWVLEKFPESGMRLPWNSFAKVFNHA